jgi:hypothetical protein
MSVDTVKNCQKCNVEKTAHDNFLWVKTRWHSWCNHCRKVEKKKWDDKNKEHVLKTATKWHYENYERVKDRKIETATRWIQNNKEKHKEYAKTCYNNNKDKSFANSAKYRAKKRNAVPPLLTKDMELQIETLFKQARELTIASGVKHEVDHIIPLQGKTVSGLHVPWNLRVITQFENRSKRNNLEPENV